MPPAPLSPLLKAQRFLGWYQPHTHSHTGPSPPAPKRVVTTPGQQQSEQGQEAAYSGFGVLWFWGTLASPPNPLCCCPRVTRLSPGAGGLCGGTVVAQTRTQHLAEGLLLA